MSGPVLTTPEDVVNAALSRIGLKIRVGSLLEGSEPSKVALDIYGQTRDQLLREGDWGFARRDATLVLLKTGLTDYVGTPWSSVYPPYPWRYEYTYPADCLKVRSVLNARPGFAPNFDPPVPRWDTPNDSSYSPAQKVLVSNIGPAAVLVYTGQIADPATWEANFAEALIDELAVRMAPALAKQGFEVQKAAEPETAAAETRAVMTQG